jgi:hypothetical protein
LPHIAGVEDYQVALATFLAARQRWPTRHRGPTVWLAFLNTVRTEHFDQVLALRPIMAAIANAA